MKIREEVKESVAIPLGDLEDGDVFRLLKGGEWHDPINDEDFNSDDVFLKIRPREVEIEDGIEAGHVATATAITLDDGLLVAFDENLKVNPLNAELVIKGEISYDAD